MKVNTINKKHRRGLETVEAAIILPVVMLVTFGALKYGWIFLKYQQITNITRYAGRIACLNWATEGYVRAQISNRMTAAGIENYSESWVTYQPSDPGVGQPLTITITVPATAATRVDILPMPNLVPSPTSLTATVTMSKEGSG